MSLHLKILNGKRKGDVFRLQNGVKIGRKNVDISVRDPKISSFHAVVEESGDNLYLVDQNSRNKIAYQGLTLEKLLLEPGMQFVLGDTEFEVFNPENTQNQVLTWKEQVLHFLKELQRESSGPRNALHLFKKCIRIQCIAGPEMGQTWILAYGPRQAGSSAIDLRFEESLDFDVLFEIREEAGKILIESPHPEQIQIHRSTEKADTYLAVNGVDFGATKLRIDVIP
jgi:hypothetical protein